MELVPPVTGLEKKSGTSAADRANNQGQKAKEAVQDTAGHFIGDKDLQAKGKGNRVAADIRLAGEKAKDALRR